MAPPTEQLTKKQRENSKKSGRVAAEKEEAEKERLDRLASHRRELDRARLVITYLSPLGEMMKADSFFCFVSPSTELWKLKGREINRNLRLLEARM